MSAALKTVALVASSSAPAAPYPADTKAKGWRFELDYERIDQSDTWVLATPNMRPWLLMLWLTAWRQVPCGSLPAADELIAARIGLDVRQFRAHRDILLRGWWLADDGRLYHPVITEQVLGLTAMRTKGADRKRGFDQKVSTIKERDSHACVYCGADKYLTVDHLVPFSRGGGHGDENLVTACRDCNSSKSDRTPDEAGMTFVSDHGRSLWESLKNNGLGELVRGRNALLKRGNAGRTTPEPEPEPEPEEKKHIRAVKARPIAAPDGFADFWAAWPNTERKANKKGCATAWQTKRLDAQRDVILAHIEALRATRKWQEGFEPAPMTYLRQERWKDGEPVGESMTKGFI